MSNPRLLLTEEQRALVGAVRDLARDKDFRGNSIKYLDGTSRNEAIWHVIFPAALPNIINTLRVTMGWAWTYLVVAELVASNSGLGYMSMQAMRGLHADYIFVGILVIGVLGLATDQIFKWIKTACLPWAEQR